MKQLGLKSYKKINRGIKPCEIFEQPLHCNFQGIALTQIIQRDYITCHFSIFSKATYNKFTSTTRKNESNG